MDWNALFRVDKILEKRMHNTSSRSYHSISLIKVSVKSNNNNNNNSSNNNNNNNNNNSNNNGNNK